MKRKRNSLVYVSSPPPTPVIGIDLGTTFSSVSVYRNGKVEIIPTKDGDRRIPSIVHFDPETGQVSVGRKAKELMEHCPENGIMDAKRIIGRKNDDDFISRYIKSEQTFLTLVDLQDGHAAFPVKVKGFNIFKMPNQVIAELLRYLKNIASDYLGTIVAEAVITIPACSSIPQKRFIKEAAEYVGVKVLRLVTEPTAAAVHYVSLCKQNRNANLLVFNFGGGVLDVAVINTIGKKVKVKAVYGDSLLGGRNFDETLFQYFQKDSLPKIGKATLKEKCKLMNACIYLKEKLTTQTECVLSTRNFATSFAMTRRAFEELSKDIFERCLNVVELCLHDGGLSKSDIDEVVLAGGSAKIPKIREMLKIYFKDKPIYMAWNLDQAVAAGTSILAASLKDKTGPLSKYSVKEVTPSSLGIEIAEKCMVCYVPKYSSLPTTITDTITTSTNNEHQLRVRIFEGERKNTEYNNHVVDAMVNGLPIKRAGGVNIELSFVLDENGLLSIQAYEGSTGNKFKVTMSNFGLSERRIIRTVRQKKRNETVDDLFERFNDARYNYRSRCNDILYEINKISNRNDRNFVENACKNFTAISHELQFTEIDKFKEAFENFMKSINEILKNNQMDDLQYIPIKNTYYYNLRSRNVAYHLPE